MNKNIVVFHEHEQIADETLKYAVIVARYNGKWIFCRHNERSTYEIPGVRREPRENIDDTARRELFEETGAISFELYPICVYSYNDYGKLYFAEVTELAPLSDKFEIAEIELFNTLPDNLTYPAIQPHLYKKVQIWLNLQSAKDEIWDIYDENRMLTGRTQRRGDPIKPGDYHLVVHVWLQNSKGEYLITKRAPNKGYPNIWECTGGSAVSGDDSITAAIREVKEETGLDVKAENGKCVFSFRRDNAFDDIWLFRQDFNLSDVVLQENETVDAKYATKDEIKLMNENSEFITAHAVDEFHYVNDLFKA